MKKYKHIIGGLLICSLYFINSIVIKFSVEKYITYRINTSSKEQITDYLTQNNFIENLNLNYYTLTFIVMFWLYLGLIILIGIGYRRQIVNKFTFVRKNSKAFIVKLFKYLGGLLVLSIIVYGVNIAFFPDYQTTIGENQSVINQVVLNNPNLYVFVVVILFAPIIEEYIFRYGLINQLLKYQKPAIQIGISALIFSLIHLNIEQFLLSPIYFLHLLLLYLPMAVVYGYVYVKEKNIVFPLTIHILNNIGSILFVLIVN